MPESRVAQSAKASTTKATKVHEGNLGGVFTAANLARVLEPLTALG